MEVYVFIFNKFLIENKECVEFNCNFGYYILVVRYYLCIIFNYLFFWYRIIIFNEVLILYVFKKEIICGFRWCLIL